MGKINLGSAGGIRYDSEEQDFMYREPFYDNEIPVSTIGTVVTTAVTIFTTIGKTYEFITGAWNWIFPSAQPAVQPPALPQPVQQVQVVQQVQAVQQLQPVQQVQQPVIPHDAGSIAGRVKIRRAAIRR